jgi:hypothetical protein
MLGFIGLVACTDVDSSAKKVLALKKMNLLITADHSISRLFPFPDSTSPNVQWLWGSARIKAGIDLRNIAAEDIQIDQTSIRINAPAIQVLSSEINPLNLRSVYNSSAEPLSEDQRNKAMAIFTKEINTSMDLQTVLSEAETKASIFLSGYLKKVGFSRIRIKFESTPSLSSKPLL